MKNLLGRLMSRPFDELKAISDIWGVHTKDPAPSQNDLAIASYHAMVDPSAVRGVWESLDDEVRWFVTWLLAQRNMLALADDLPAHLSKPREEVAALLERTRVAGLIDVDEALVRGSRVVSSGDNLYAWGARNQPEAVRRRVVSIAAELGKVLTVLIEESKRVPPFDEPFAVLLGGIDQEAVQRIAQTWRLPDAARYYKSELIGVMNEFLATGQGRESLLSALPPHSQRAFTFIQENGGRVRASQLRTYFSWDEREFRAAVTPLISRALVWDVLEGQSRFLFIPVDLLSGRRGETAAVVPGMLPKLEAPTPYSVESRLPYEMTWDLLTLLAAASEGELSLTLQDTRITKRVAKRINDAFLQPEDLKGGTTYIDMVVHMAQMLGLLAENNDEQPALVLTPRVDEWVKLSFSAQRRRLFGVWLEDRKWSEPATYGTIYWWNSDLTDGRKRLIAHLSELPVGEWVLMDAFLRKIHITEPFLIWSQDELVRRFGLRALQGFRSQWFNIEGRIIADMVKNMLAWLGAVELGKDKQKRLVSFRVTDAGKQLFDPDYRDTSQVPAKTLLVQPNFEVLVLHPESTVLWNLLRCADLVRHDRVSAYSINKESVLRAVEAGLSPDAIKEFLNSNTGKGLPQNVAHSIDDWSRLIKRATLSRATLVEVDDPSVLDEMLASRKTRKYILKRVSPTIALANLEELAGSGRDTPWQRLMKELKSAGYFPRYAGDELDAGPSNGSSGGTEPTRIGDSARGKADQAAARKSGESRARGAGKGSIAKPSTSGISGAS